MSRFNHKKAAKSNQKKRRFIKPTTVIISTEQAAGRYGKTDEFTVRIVPEFHRFRMEIKYKPFMFLKRSQKKRRKIARQHG